MSSELSDKLIRGGLVDQHMLHLLEIWGVSPVNLKVDHMDNSRAVMRTLVNDVHTAILKDRYAPPREVVLEDIDWDRWITACVIKRGHEDITFYCRAVRCGLSYAVRCSDISSVPKPGDKVSFDGGHFLPVVVSVFMDDGVVLVDVYSDEARKIDNE